MSEERSRLLLVSSVIVAIVLLHYGTPGHMMYLHVLLQAFFFIPVSLSGWWFGRRGGLIAAAVITATYVHHAVTVMIPTSELAVSNAIQIFLLFLAGILTGTYTNLKRSYQEATSGSSHQPMMLASTEQKILVYLDQSGASMNAVHHIANLFGGGYDAAVTLLYVSRSQGPASDKPDADGPESAKSGIQVMETAKSLLLRSGFTEANIETRFANAQDKRTSDVILMEQKSGAYSTIAVGRHSLSRAEEFLFGSVAIRLARQSPCPVWIIGEAGVAQHTVQHVKETANTPEDAKA